MIPFVAAGTTPVALVSSFVGRYRRWRIALASARSHFCVRCSLAQKLLESVEKLGSEQILFAVTIPCCATEYCREEQRQ